ncbi:MAG: hypothetical protein CSA31_01675 [Desulfobulbus propionicus]|nr:MAG: hypothetical protein CSA31_01675 [Desulfobulbus propionicus]
MKAVNDMHKRGFTLLEVLLAISILAVVSFTVGVAVRSSVLMYDGVREQTGLHRQARIIWQRMSEDLAAAVIHPEVDFIGEQKEVGGVRADVLKFASLAHLEFDPQVSGGGLAIIHYRTETDVDNPQELRLIRADQRYLPGDEQEDAPGFVLGQHLKSFELSYLDSEGQEYDTWDSSKIKSKFDNANERLIPQAVKMSFVFWADQDHKETFSFRSAVVLVADDLGADDTGDE